MATKLLIDGKDGTINITSGTRELFNSNRPYIQFKEINTPSTFTWASLPTTEITLLEPSPRGRGGRSCFTKETLITLSSGDTKNISLIKPGDLVLSKDLKTHNKVVFIETHENLPECTLYSPPLDTNEPFITIEHPIYINNILVSPISKKLTSIFPWIKNVQQLNNANICIKNNVTVYNLLVEGDGTYIVNNYPTTSIIGNGGYLVDCFYKGLLTEIEVSGLIREFSRHSKNTVLGAYIINSRLKICYTIVSKLLKHHYGVKLIMGLSNLIGTLYSLRK